MAMSDAEKAVVVSLLKNLVDTELPAILAAEVARLPVAYQPIVGVVETAVVPQIVAALDKVIASI